MALQLKVNGVDKTNQIAWDSLIKTEVITKEPDTLTFNLRNYGSKTWRPSLNDTVQFYNGATLLFAGIVVATNEIIAGLAITLSVTCKDYTELLDRHLVAKEYDNMSGN